MRRFLTGFILFVVMLTFLSVASAEPPSGETITDGQHEKVDDSIFLVTPSNRPVLSWDWDSKTRILLARSCVGEARFDAVEECMAIAWCYAKRSRKLGWRLKKMIQRYSAAVKPHERHRRPWLFELNARGTEPRSWPRNLSWKKHRRLWRNLLAALDLWQSGYVKDPYPDSDHFGSKQDARIAYYVNKWKRLETPGYLNWFFDSTKKAIFNVPRRRNRQRL